MNTARVAELVYAVDLKSTGAQPFVGSTPTSRTNLVAKEIHALLPSQGEEE